MTPDYLYFFPHRWRETAVIWSVYSIQVAVDARGPRRASCQNVSAVDNHGVSLHKASLGGAEEQRDVCDLVGLPNPADGCHLHKRLLSAAALVVPRRHGRLDHARAHAVDPDAVLGVVYRVGAREGYDGRLGCAVRSYKPSQAPSLD